MSDTPARVSRRDLLLGGTGAALGAAAGFGAGELLAHSPRQASAEGTAAPDGGPAEPGAAVPVTGAHQAGIDRPATPQRHGLIVVCDAPAVVDREGVFAMLAQLGATVDDCMDPAQGASEFVPDGAGDLTVTIGIGPRLASLIDAALPGAVPLPAFAGDDRMPRALVGGDVLLAVHASDASVLGPVADAVTAVVPGNRLRWRQACFRGAGEGTVVRNPLGYHDGVIVPRGADEMAENVWISEGAAAGGTVAVVRRLRLDIRGFHAEGAQRQDEIIGRSRRDGAPLSGGRLADEADLTAKTPDGRYLVPLRSHVRAAHPAFTGSALMLRRGYAYSNSTPPGEDPDDGLLFICFQRELDTFVRTQRRLDETDDLMGYVTPTASASFLIPPGRREGERLGERLRGA